MLCISCGNNLKEAHKFCGSCGAKVNSNLTNLINNSPQGNIVVPLNFNLLTIPIEISKVKIEEPDTDNSYTITVSSNFTNTGKEDWDFLQIKIHLLNSDGLILRENTDTVEELLEANGTYAHESVFWSIPAPSLGTSPEKVIVVVSAFASQKHSREFEELNVPSSSFEISNIASTCLIGPALKLISGSMWKTQPNDDKESLIEINCLFQNLGKVIVPEARLVGDILDKKGKVLSEAGFSKEVLPGELTQLIGYCSAKETKLAGAKLKFSLITFYPVAAAVEQQNGGELVANESNDVPWPFEDLGSEQDDIIDIDGSENSASTKSFEWSMKLGEINMDDVEDEEVLSALKNSFKLAKAKKFEDAVNALPPIDFEYSFGNLDSDASDYFAETEGISFGLDLSNSEHTIQVAVSGGKLNLSVTVVFDIPVKDGVNLDELNEWLGENGGYAAGFASGGWSYNGDEGGHMQMVEVEDRSPQNIEVTYENEIPDLDQVDKSSLKYLLSILILYINDDSWIVEGESEGNFQFDDGVTVNASRDLFHDVDEFLARFDDMNLWTNKKCGDVLFSNKQKVVIELKKKVNLAQCIYTFNFDGLLNTAGNDNEFIIWILSYGGDDCGCYVDIRNNLDEDFLKSWLADVITNNKKVSVRVANNLEENDIQSNEIFEEDIESDDSEIITDKQTLLAVVTKNGYKLSSGSEDLKNDVEVVLAAVANYGLALEYASDKLKNNNEVVNAAIEDSIYSFKYAGKDILNNYDMVLKAVKVNGTVIQHISKNLIKDRSIVLAAVTSNSSALEYVSNKFQDDKEIVLEAMRNSGSAFSFVSKNLQLDEEVVKLAVASYPNTLRDIDEKYLNNKQIVLSAVKTEGNLLEYASETLKSDIDIITAAASNDPSVLKNASNYIRSNDKLILNLLEKNKIYLQYASSHLRENSIFIKLAEINIFEKLKESGDLIDVYSKEWLLKQPDGSQLNEAIASEFDKKFGDQFRGHLKVIYLSNRASAFELATVYPQLQQQIKDDTPTHIPNFLFINMKLNKILCVGLGRKNRIFILDSDTNEKVYVSGVPGNSNSNKKYIQEFTNMDHANVVKTIVQSLHDASILMDEQEDFDEYDSEDYENLCDRLNEVVQGIQFYFPHCEAGDLNSGDYY